MKTKKRVEELIVAHSIKNIEDAKFLVMDDQSYFELKEELFGSVEVAIEQELEEWAGLKVFHNNIGYTFIDVA